MIETYLPVLNFSGYRVSNIGNVQSCWKRGRYPKMLNIWNNLTYHVHEGGYYYVNLTKDRVTTHEYNHVLVLNAFSGLAPKGQLCRHLNGIPTDNRYIENIIWGTPKENTADIFKHGRFSIGKDHYRAKTTEKDVLEIRNLAKQGLSQIRIGEQFGLCQASISKIILRETWSHVVGEPCPF